jgi:hypothetical protein
MLSLAGFNSSSLSGSKLSESLNCELEVPDAYRNILHSCFDIRITDDVKEGF